MLKRLGSAGLVEQVPYRGVFLTHEGEKLAEESRARHHVVEMFCWRWASARIPRAATRRGSNITSAMKL